MAEIILLLLGLLGLWLGTEVAVRGALRLSEYFGWSQVMVGMTILAFGTDLPELVVAIRGSLDNLAGIDTSGLILGNAIGSCTAQFGIVAGTIALLSSLELQNQSLSQLAMQTVGSVLLLQTVLLGGTVGRLEGLILLAFFGLYLYFLAERQGSVSQATGKGSLWTMATMILAGLGLVLFSADLVLTQAMELSDRFGLRQSFVGAVIVALGTSLPELGISLNAAIKKQAGLSLGNLTGSNVFDTLVPIGASACIAPLKVGPAVLDLDMPFLLAMTVLFLFFLGTRAKLGPREGGVLIAVYLAYVGLSITLSR